MLRRQVCGVSRQRIPCLGHLPDPVMSSLPVLLLLATRSSRSPCYGNPKRYFETLWIREGTLSHCILLWRNTQQDKNSQIAHCGWCFNRAGTQRRNCPGFCSACSLPVDLMLEGCHYSSGGVENCASSPPNGQTTQMSERGKAWLEEITSKTLCALLCHVLDRLPVWRSENISLSVCARLDSTQNSGENRPGFS